MKLASEQDRFLGMDYYITDSPGCGGIIRRNPEDFLVVEVFEDRLELEQPGSRSGARAAVVLRGRVTELADVDAMADHVAPDFWAHAGSGRPGPQEG